jgi:4'-phosphopantetheinyl transferase
MQPATRRDQRSGWRPIASPDADARLWLVDVGPGAAPPNGASALSQDEIARGARFHRAEDRARFTLTRAALRHLLSGAAALEPDELVFVTGPHGKPALAGRPDLHFNVSHSGALALIGISARRPVGVDIERVRTDIDDLALAEAFFCTAEHRFLDSLDDAARRAAFYRIWTCKEAVLKALGRGITENLKDFRVRLGQNGVDLEPQPGCLAHALAAVRAAPVDVPAGYAATLALA